MIISFPSLKADQHCVTGVPCQPYARRLRQRRHWDLAATIRAQSLACIALCFNGL